MKIQQKKKEPWTPLKSVDPKSPLSAQELALAYSKNDENLVQILGVQGGRGTGKTEVTGVMYLQHVNKGFGPNWKGLCVRHSYDALKDVFNRFKIIKRNFV